MSDEDESAIERMGRFVSEMGIMDIIQPRYIDAARADVEEVAGELEQAKTRLMVEECENRKLRAKVEELEGASANTLVILQSRATYAGGSELRFVHHTIETLTTPEPTAAEDVADVKSFINSTHHRPSIARYAAELAFERLVARLDDAEFNYKVTRDANVYVSEVLGGVAAEDYVKKLTKAEQRLARIEGKLREVKQYSYGLEGPANQYDVVWNEDKSDGDWVRLEDIEALLAEVNEDE
jgi:hypothetical protein